MLTREQRDKWADALESGEFQQTRFRLNDTVGYCCLGVFCKIENLKIPDGSKGEFDYTPIYDLFNYLLGPDERKMFVDMNDSEGKTFKEIAVVVRSLPVVEDAPQSPPS